MKRSWTPRESQLRTCTWTRSSYPRNWDMTRTQKHRYDWLPSSCVQLALRSCGKAGAIQNHFDQNPPNSPWSSLSVQSWGFEPNPSRSSGRVRPERRVGVQIPVGFWGMVHAECLVDLLLTPRGIVSMKGLVPVREVPYLGAVGYIFGPLPLPDQRTKISRHS